MNFQRTQAGGTFLVTKAKDIMTTELILGHPNMTVEDAIKALVNNRITGLPIVDNDRKIVGVLSEYDVIKSVEGKTEKHPIDLGAKIDFTAKVTTIGEDAPLPEIFSLFLEKKVRRLPVVNSKEELVGIITRRDVMRVLFYRSKSL